MFDFFIKKMAVYKKLKEKYEFIKHQKNELENQIKNLKSLLSKREMWLEHKEDEIFHIKEIAEDVLQVSRKLIKKDEIVQAQKDIEILCKKIIGD